MATVLGNFGGKNWPLFISTSGHTVGAGLSIYKRYKFSRGKNNLTVVWDGRVMAGSIGVGVGGGYI